MGFFNICPRDRKYLQFSVGSIPLKVIRSNGVSMKPDIDIKVSNLSGGSKHFLNNSHQGGTFKIDVLIHRNDVVQGRYYNVMTISKNVINKTGTSLVNNPYYIGNQPIITDYTENIPVTKLLDSLIRNMTPVLVTTSAIDIPNGQYIITENSSRKQTYSDTTEWELEFTTYSPLNLYKYKNNNSAIQKALNKMKNKGSSATNKKKLKKCNYKKLKYSKKKKVVKCVKYLQKVLKSNKCYSGKIDGWFGKDTVSAVKKFQKKKKLKKTGKVNKKTFKALCK